LGEAEADRMLNKNSGLKALAGDNNMKTLLERDDPEAAFAVDHFCYWAARHAGSAIVAMGGVDAFAFTGGIGENAEEIRSKIMAHLHCFGDVPVHIIAADEEKQIARLTLIVIVAGIVRGFSGFALSALVMASAVVILPPVELIPICLILELAASLLMARGGWQEADRGTVLGLVIGSTIGVPIGLAGHNAVGQDPTVFSGHETRALRCWPDRRHCNRSRVRRRNGRRTLCPKPGHQGRKDARSPCAVSVYLIAYNVDQPAIVRCHGFDRVQARLDHGGSCIGWRQDRPDDVCAAS